MLPSELPLLEYTVYLPLYFFYFFYFLFLDARGIWSRNAFLTLLSVRTVTVMSMPIGVNLLTSVPGPEQRGVSGDQIVWEGRGRNYESQALGQVDASNPDLALP